MNAVRSSILIVTLLLAGGAAWAGERFTGNVVDVGGNLPGRNSAPFIVQVDSWSTDEEVSPLAQVLAAKGPDALREAAWDVEKGWIRVGGSLGYPIAVARSRSADGGGRVVRLMIDRPLDFFEVVRNLRTTDYPFSIVELQLDAEGKGEGQLIAAASLRLTGSTLDVESYGPQPFRLMAVRAREAH